MRRAPLCFIVYHYDSIVSYLFTVPILFIYLLLLLLLESDGTTISILTSIRQLGQRTKTGRFYRRIELWATNGPRSPKYSPAELVSRNYNYTMSVHVVVVVVVCMYYYDMQYIVIVNNDALCR
jgi:hypothetical protein